VLKPTVALRKEDLPSDNAGTTKMGKVTRNLRLMLKTWAEDPRDGRASPVSPPSVSPASMSARAPGALAEPQFVLKFSSPTAAADEPKPKRKGGRTPKSAEARKVEAKATQQQVRRFSDSQDKVISKLEEELVKLEEELAKERVKSHDFDKVIRHMQQQLLGVDLERAEAVEALEKYIVEKPDKHAESVIGAVKFFEGGRYTDTIRTIYYTLLKNEMSPGRCHIVVGSVEMRGSAELQSTGERSHKGPKGSTGARPA
jgi:hypothetical protein